MFAARAASTAAWRLLAVAQQQQQPTRRRMAALSVHAFHADGTSQPAAGRRSTPRPSKTAAKVEAKHFQVMSRELARLTEKQLARLEPLLGEELVGAAALAASISHRNQGRQRQENLVARMLREATAEGELEQLRAAIDSVRTGQGAIANPAVARQLEAWLAALLAGQTEAATQVFGLTTEAGGDLQQLRQLVRQAQQTEPVPAAAEDSDSEGEPAAAAAAAPAPAAPGGVRLTAKARAARKQLRKLLQPLAEAHLGAEEEEQE